MGERGEGQIPESAWTTLAQARRNVFDVHDVSVWKCGAGAWRSLLPNGCDEIWVHRLALGGAS